MTTFFKSYLPRLLPAVLLAAVVIALRPPAQGPVQEPPVVRQYILDTDIDARCSILVLEYENDDGRVVFAEVAGVQCGPPGFAPDPTYTTPLRVK